MEKLWPPRDERPRKHLDSDRHNIRLSHGQIVRFASDIIPDSQNIGDLNRSEETAFVILTKHNGREIFEFDFVKDNDRVFVKEFPDVISSVERIKRHYPKNQIIVIDADSPNKEYQSIIRNIDKSIIIENIANNNYESGGIIYAFKKYKNYFKSFFFLQDSILLTGSGIKEINNLKDDNVWYSIQECNSGWCHRSDRDISGKWILDTKCVFNIRDSAIFKNGRYNPIFIGDIQLESLNDQIIASYDTPFPIAYCCSFLVSTKLFEKVLNTNILKSCPLPYNKISNCAWERLWALAFYELDASIKFFDGIEIIYWYGDAAGDRGANYTNKFIKFYLGRK